MRSRYCRRRSARCSVTRLPLPQVHVDEPVHELADLPFDLLRRVGDDLLLEPLLHPAAIQQIHRRARSASSRRSNRGRAAPSRAGCGRCRPCGTRSRGQILLIDRQLPLDLVQRGEVLLEQRRAARGRRAACRSASDAATPSGFSSLRCTRPGASSVAVDVALERLEAARRPDRRVALLGAQREPRADGKDLRVEAEQRCALLRDERA